MKTVVPDYYSDFRCLAGDCRHSCCIGWEIDIDDDTLEYYNTVEGPFGNRLHNSISYDSGTPHFCMDSHGKCAFLNENGLCDIMLNLGFDKVSQICDDHPRFRNFYSDRTEIGLGLSCEAVAMQILSKQDKTQLITLEENDELLWEDEEVFLSLRDEIFAIIQDRTQPVNNRVASVLAHCGVQLLHYTPQQQAELFCSLERLDPVRDELLLRLKNATDETLHWKTEAEFATAFEQLLVYFAFRHLTESLDDGRFAGRLQYVVQSYYLIRNLCAVHHNTQGRISLEDMAEICRIYSAETEYSPENMNILFDKFS